MSLPGRCGIPRTRTIAVRSSRRLAPSRATADGFQKQRTIIAGRAESALAEFRAWQKGQAQGPQRPVFLGVRCVSDPVGVGKDARESIVGNGGCCFTNYERSEIPWLRACCRSHGWSL